MEPLDRDELQEGITAANEEAQRSQTSQFHTSQRQRERTWPHRGGDLVSRAAVKCQIVISLLYFSCTADAIVLPVCVNILCKKYGCTSKVFAPLLYNSGGHLNNTSFPP